MSVVKYEDFFDKDLFERLQREIDAVIKKLHDLAEIYKKSAKDIVSETKKQEQSLKEYVKSVDTAVKQARVAAQLNKEAKTLANDLIKLEKLLATTTKETADKIREKINALDSLAEKEKFVAEAIRDLSKDLKKQAEEQLTLIKVTEALEKAKKREFESYADLVDTLETLRDAYKSVAASGQEIAGVSERELRKIVNSLDRQVKAIDESVGLFQKNVGAYKEKVVEAFSSIGGAIGESIVQSKSFSQSITNIVVGSLQTAITAFAKGATAAQRFGNALSALGKSAVYLLALEAVVKTIQVISDRISRALTNFDAKLADFKERTIEFIQVNNQLFVINQKIESLRSQQTIQNLLDENRLLSQSYDLRRRLLLLKEQEIEQQIQEAREQINILSTAEEVMNAEKQIAELMKQKQEISFEIVSLNKEELNRRLEIFQTLQQIRKEVEDFVIANFKARDTITRIAQDSIAAQIQVQRQFEELRKKIAGDPELLQRLQTAYKRALENIRLDAEKALNDFILDTNSIAIQALAQIAPITSGILQSFRDVYDVQELIANRLIEIRKGLENAERIGGEEARRSLQAQAEILSVALENILQMSKKGTDVIEQQRERLRELLATTAAEEEREVLQYTREKEKRIEELIKIIQDLDTAIQAFMRAGVFGEAVEQAIALRKETVQALETLKRYYDERIALAAFEADKKRLEKERDLLLQRLDLARETQIAIANEEEAALFQRERNLQKREEIEKLYRKRLLEIELQYQREVLATLQRYGLQEDEVRIQQVRQRIANIEKELASLTTQTFEAANKRIFEETQKTLEAALEVFNEFQKRILERQLRNLNLQSQILQNRAQLLIALAQRGAVGVQDSLAEIEKQQQAIERQRQELQRRQQQREAYIAALKAYSAALAQGANPAKALFDTLRNISVLQAFIRSLPAFYAGTEEISTKNALKVNNLSRDAFIVRVHEGERIVPAHINKQLRGIKNEDLPKMINQSVKIEFDYDKIVDAIAVAIERKNYKKVIKRPL
jgi:hypothetical protein